MELIRWERPHLTCIFRSRRKIGESRQFFDHRVSKRLEIEMGYCNYVPLHCYVLQSHFSQAWREIAGAQVAAIIRTDNPAETASLSCVCIRSTRV